MSAFYIYQPELDVEVVRTIQPGIQGWIVWNQSVWRAQCSTNATLFPGDRAYIVGQKGAVLLVEPLESDDLAERTVGFTKSDRRLAS